MLFSYETLSRQSHYLMSKTKPTVKSFWLVLWTCTLAPAWLLPNHYWPWLSFHSDAWVALAFSVLSAVIIWRECGPVAWHRITVLVGLLALMPWLQYGFGLIQQAGVAWISCAYLVGLLLALLTGARWESSSPGQLGDGLFLAIGLAALLSVGLQLQQWLQLDGLELWTMGGNADRPHANFGQPNQLATFLLWGLLATMWGLMRQRIAGGIALLMAVYLLFGIALTASRTAWLGVALLVAAIWWWRHLWTNKLLPWIATGLALYFLLCLAALSWWQHASAIVLQTGLSDLARMSGELRPLAWATFLDAAWQRPFFGYGWNQVALAQMAVATEHPGLHSVFTYSHNLFLDLVLWCGVPVGLLVAMALLRWFWKRIYAVQSSENAVLLMFLLVLASHAMLELPLYYAYFLLPAGLVMGSLHTRLKVCPIMVTGRRVSFALWLTATTLLVLIIRDYSRIETSYQTLRLEWARIKITMPVGPPDVLLLTQWRDYISYARIEPKAGLSADELDWMRNITGLHPSAILIHKLATILAMNQRPDEARRWLQRLCKITPETDCLSVKTIWAKQALRHPEVDAVEWPN